jgi:steroid 5-alpha reductase family enzyme
MGACVWGLVPIAVFALQAVLAWIVSLPLYAAITNNSPLGMLDLAGCLCGCWDSSSRRWAAGAWWSIAGPMLISVLLLRVSGATLLEKDIGERRPEYEDYKRRTNAFLPGPPRIP